MAKKLIIKGANFSTNALNLLEPVLFNEVSDGKFKLRARNSETAFLNLTNSPDAGNWQIISINVAENIGEKIGIVCGETPSGINTDKNIVILDTLLDIIKNKNFSVATHVIERTHYIASFYTEINKELVITIPPGADTLYISFTGSAPVVRRIAE